MKQLSGSRSEIRRRGPDVEIEKDQGGVEQVKDYKTTADSCRGRHLELF